MKLLLLFIVTMFIVPVSFAQWEPDVRLTNNADSSRMWWGTSHSIASSGDTVHVVWYDKSDGNFEIYYIHSTDGGASWENATRLTNNLAKSTSPAIAVYGSVVHVVWCDNSEGNNEIFYRRSTDGGTSWEDEQRLTNDIANSYGQTISVSGSIVHIVWVSFEDGIYEIRYRQSTDSGTTWGPEIWLSNNSNYCFNPSITSTGPDVLIVWNDSRDGNLEIYSRRSLDGGLNWEPYVRLTNDPAISLTPSLSMSGSFVHLVWGDNREGNYKLFYKQSVDGGLSWSEDIRINNTVALSPNISSIDSLVCVVWTDYRAGIPEIFFKRSADGGNTWDTDVMLNDFSYSSEHPFIAISGSVLHAVWYDFRDGNFEIYYKRNPTGGLPVGIEEEQRINSDGNEGVYPNPASRQLTIVQLDNWTVEQSAIGGQQSAVRFSIFDLFGQEVKEFRNISSFPHQIDISGLPDGVYLLKIIDDSGNIGSVKFLKISE
jgi:hypothetical protein